MAIETGRHAPAIIDRNDRICIYCEITFDIRIVEDEYHFLIVCPAYQNVRTQYLSDILDTFNINNETIISILLKSFNENVVKAITFFLYHAFYVRNNNLSKIKLMSRPCMLTCYLRFLDEYGPHALDTS